MLFKVSKCFGKVSPEQSLKDEWRTSQVGGGEMT